jgi:hypothetical protein
VAHSGAPIANWCPMAGSGTAQMRLEPDRSSGLRHGIDGRGQRRLGASRKCCPMWGSISNLAPYAGRRRGGRLRDRYPFVRFAARRISRSRRGRSLRSRCCPASTLPDLDAARPRRCPASTLPGLDAAVSMLRSRSRVPGQRGGDRDRSAPRRPCGPVIGQTGRSFRSVAPGQTGWRSCPVEPRLDRSPSTCRAGLTHPRPACREARA